MYITSADKYRILAYRKALHAIKTHPFTITNSKQASKIKGIGKSIALEIQEIINFGYLSKTSTLNTEEYQSIKVFTSIYGVGDKIARKWLDLGWKTLQDVKKNSDKLTPIQKIGLTHYHDLNLKISRSEMIIYQELFSRIILQIDSGYECHLVGSFRRNQESCSDVDFIISHRNYDFVIQKAIQTILYYLKESQIQIINLTNSETPLLYKGIFKYKDNPFRRLDILMVPFEELGASMIYFTGNDLFNRRIRSLASSKGMTLNQKGLFMNESVIARETESEVFEALGMDFVEPHCRLS